MTLKEAREQLGWTQSKLCAELKIPLRTWQHWESGDRQPPEWAETLILEKLNTIYTNSNNQRGLLDT